MATFRSVSDRRLRLIGWRCTPVEASGPSTSA
jgi:hypothetical protein